jgi:tRNA(Ile)-lysidine synthase
MLKTTEQKVLKFVDENQLIDQDDKVLIALSGGADSVFLFHFLLKFKRRLGVEFSAFHLNHMIRGKDAKDDEMFCKNLCSRNSVELFVVSKNVKNYAKMNRLSIEEAGRLKRYDELQRIADGKIFTKIATAHNASDNAETVLLNLIKGAGSKGLSGIPLRRDKIIRPLLSLTNEEIRKYLKEKKISYQLDASNLGVDYERNFIRNEIIPRLKKRLNPQVEQKILNSTQIIKKMRIYIEVQIDIMVESAAKFSKGELRINLKKLNEFDKSLWSEFFKSVIENKFKIDLSTENLNSLIRIVKNQAGRKLLLSNKILVLKERTYLSIKVKKTVSKEILKMTVKLGEKTKVNGHILQIEKIAIDEVKPSRKKTIEYISAGKLKSTFQLRIWKNGDRFYPLGMKGSKKISDFLADEKVSSGKKKEQLVLTNSGKII